MSITVGVLMSALIIGATIISVAVIALSTDSEFIQLVKEVIYRLVLSGYKEEKIIYIMNFYA
jgi:hypothetical protein